MYQLPVIMRSNETPCTLVTASKVATRLLTRKESRPYDVITNTTQAEVPMALKEEEAARKKKLIGISKTEPVTVKVGQSSDVVVIRGGKVSPLLDVILEQNTSHRILKE
uniref:Uncharacterized protein n=1 Tax=Vespula pensylvanica TaxID=30213 RepID=A0A834NA40_VESPE|nr:hypothetical protein H0235_015595 [Vespula pensylvanica]